MISVNVERYVLMCVNLGDIVGAGSQHQGKGVVGRVLKGPNFPPGRYGGPGVLYPGNV